MIFVGKFVSVSNITTLKFKSLRNYHIDQLREILKTTINALEFKVGKIAKPFLFELFL